MLWIWTLGIFYSSWRLIGNRQLIEVLQTMMNQVLITTVPVLDNPICKKVIGIGFTSGLVFEVDDILLCSIYRTDEHEFKPGLLVLDRPHHNAVGHTELIGLQEGIYSNGLQVEAPSIALSQCGLWRYGMGLNLSPQQRFLGLAFL